MAKQLGAAAESLSTLEISVTPRTELKPLAGEVVLSLTTDSVVATATVALTGAMKRIFIDWGDQQTSTITSRPGLPAPENIGEADDPLPPGTYQLRHAYAEPEDKQPFETYALVRVQDWAGGDEVRIAKVVIKPRYRVTNYRMSVWLTGPCEPSWESTNEFSISQSVEGVTQRQWSWRPSNNFFSESQSFRLEDSGITRDLTVTDGSVYVTYVFTEDDTFSDDVLRFTIGMNALDESGPVEIDRNSGGCGLRAVYDREVRLIVPIPDNGQLATYE